MGSRCSISRLRVEFRDRNRRDASLTGEPLAGLFFWRHCERFAHVGDDKVAALRLARLQADLVQTRDQLVSQRLVLFARGVKVVVLDGLFKGIGNRFLQETRVSWHRTIGVTATRKRQMCFVASIQRHPGHSL